MQTYALELFDDEIGQFVWSCVTIEALSEDRAERMAREFADRFGNGKRFRLRLPEFIAPEFVIETVNERRDKYAGVCRGDV